VTGDLLLSASLTGTSIWDHGLEAHTDSPQLA
jgi:hypothetical protein